MWWGFNYLAACRGVIQVTKFTLTFETLGTDLIEFLSLYPWNLFLGMLEQKRWTELYAKGSKGSEEVQINMLINIYIPIFHIPFLFFEVICPKI